MAARPLSVTIWTVKAGSPPPTDRIGGAVRQAQLEGLGPAVPGAQFRVALPQALDERVIAGCGGRGGGLGEIAHGPSPLG